MKKKKVNFTIDLQPQKWYVRLFSKLVRFLVRAGLAGGTRLDGRFVEMWSSKTAEKNNLARAKLAAVARQHRKMIKKHFEKDGWDLDLNYIRQEVLRDFLGFETSDVITANLVKGLPIDQMIRADGSYLVKRK